MKITYRKGPIKELRGMQPAKSEDIRDAVRRMAADPSAKYNNVRAIKGVKNGFRIRVGDWRVLYTLDRDANVLDVFEIRPRGGAY